MPPEPESLSAELKKELEDGLKQDDMTLSCEKNVFTTLFEAEKFRTQASLFFFNVNPNGEPPTRFANALKKYKPEDRLLVVVYEESEKVRRIMSVLLCRRKNRKKKVFLLPNGKVYKSVTDVLKKCFVTSGKWYFAFYEDGEDGFCHYDGKFTIYPMESSGEHDLYYLISPKDYQQYCITQRKSLEEEILEKKTREGATRNLYSSNNNSYTISADWKIMDSANKKISIENLHQKKDAWYESKKDDICYDVDSTYSKLRNKNSLNDSRTRKAFTDSGVPENLLPLLFEIGRQATFRMYPIMYPMYKDLSLFMIYQLRVFLQSQYNDEVQANHPAYKNTDLNDIHEELKVLKDEMIQRKESFADKYKSFERHDAGKDLHDFGGGTYFESLEHQRLFILTYHHTLIEEPSYTVDDIFKKYDDFIKDVVIPAESGFEHVAQRSLIFEDELRRRRFYYRVEEDVYKPFIVDIEYDKMRAKYVIKQIKPIEPVKELSTAEKEKKEKRKKKQIIWRRIINRCPRETLAQAVQERVNAIIEIIIEEYNNFCSVKRIPPITFSDLVNRYEDCGQIWKQLNKRLFAFNNKIDAAFHATKHTQDGEYGFPRLFESTVDQIRSDVASYFKDSCETDSALKTQKESNLILHSEFNSFTGEMHVNAHWSQGDKKMVYVIGQSGEPGFKTNFFTTKTGDTNKHVAINASTDEQSIADSLLVHRFNNCRLHQPRPIFAVIKKDLMHNMNDMQDWAKPNFVEGLACHLHNNRFESAAVVRSLHSSHYFIGMSWNVVKFKKQDGEQFIQKMNSDFNADKSHYMLTRCDDSVMLLYSGIYVEVIEEQLKPILKEICALFFEGERKEFDKHNGTSPAPNSISDHDLASFLNRVRTAGLPFDRFNNWSERFPFV
ncbi:hypothetical protein QR680_011619 [Steinernema hermaphroditum]|uniref:Uncharacterized protein n=1 Tax=Steinernema hermaphroditum TaxID=289476 RepID=A0AA39LYZ8_9BILA|nr:hypothetical protein QR680_011619 [Steinernema hermaphroditum]